MPNGPIPQCDLGPEILEIRPALDAAWSRVVDSTHFVLGPEVEAFEQEVARYLGSRFAVGVNSGTDALIIALRALGISPGSEVITTSFSFFATAEAILAVGATPVFVDVGLGNFNILPELIEARIGSKTRALIPVHLFGHACDMAAIQDIARRHRLVVVEDVAQAFGGRYRSRALGTFGHAGAFSFFPSKNLGCFGDGGLVATDDPDTAQACRHLRAHGAKTKYFNEVSGYNSRLDALQASVLRAKLPHITAWNELRRSAAKRYDSLLADIPGVMTPKVADQVEHVFHQYTIRVLNGRRDVLKRRLEQAGIGSAIYYPFPLHRLPPFVDSPPCENADALSREVLSLPFWPRISVLQQERVASAIRQAQDVA